MVIVPPGTYREQVMIEKPLTLVGEPGAEIRGSDIWVDWQRSGASWTAGPAPEFAIHGGTCREGTTDCRQRLQVYMDGVALGATDGIPTSGQFAVQDGLIVIADDPTGHVVEVTTRDAWVIVESDDVKIEGFTMRHASSHPQSGGIQSTDVNRLTVRGNTLVESHGAAIVVNGGEDHLISANDLRSNGQLGVKIAGTLGGRIERNLIRDNNTVDYDPAWEAGGLKAIGVTGLAIVGNEVCGNDGPGLWCDIDCENIVVRDNRVHANGRAGIFFEISRGASIESNVVWANGWDFPAWGWGAGILISSAADVRVAGNVVAWNADGISVISQDREEQRWNRVENVHVTDNDVLVDPVGGDTYALAWLDDWASGMFAADRNNIGMANRYWYARREDGRDRFAWAGSHASLGRFEATLGEERARYHDGSARDSIIGEAILPPAP